LFTSPLGSTDTRMALPVDHTKRVYVAGHTGLIGSALTRRLQQDGYTHLILARRAELDLTQAADVDGFFQRHRPQIVFLAAGRVGGIVENQTYPADFITQNLALQVNVLQAAQRYGVERFVFFASSCMYPRECPQPMVESMLLAGKPEPTSLPYAISKLAGTQMCLAYNKQYGATRFLPVIPNSAYGPYDNFDPKSGHVLSALIARFHEAKTTGAESVTLWGTGSPRREFVHVDDIADACLHLLRQDLRNIELPLNIGVGSDISIKELAETIRSVVGYGGRVEWDHSKPDGAPRKLLDESRLRNMGWHPKVGLADGLRNTYAWYVQRFKELALEKH